MNTRSTISHRSNLFVPPAGMPFGGNSTHLEPEPVLTHGLVERFGSGRPRMRNGLIRRVATMSPVRSSTRASVPCLPSLSILLTKGSSTEWWVTPSGSEPIRTTVPLLQSSMRKRSGCDMNADLAQSGDSFPPAYVRLPVQTPVHSSEVSAVLEAR